MRSPRRFITIVFAALIMALAGSWSSQAMAHAARHAGHPVPCAEMPAATGTAQAPDATSDERIMVASEIDDRGGTTGAACPSSCCAGGASCAWSIAGLPAVSLGLPDLGRPAFDAPREIAPAQSAGERLPKPPRG